MKKLILIPILFLSYILNAQYVVVKPSQLPPATTINVSDIFIINQGVTTKKLPYSILNTVLKDTFITRTELGDTARAIRDDFPTGGGGFASDGVYMDGDTVKLGRELLLNESLSDHYGINNDGIGGYMNIEGFQGGALWLGYNDNQTNYHLQIDQFGVGINSYGALVNPNLRIDTTGIHYITSPDTTLTTPNHLMTEQQVKREIAAAQRWTDISGGISYGNEVTVGSLAGTGDRNIGVDASGKLKVLNGGISDNTSDTVIYNAKFMTTSSTDTYCVYTIPTDGKYLLMSNLEIDFYDGCTVAASTIFGEMHYGEYDYVSTGISVPTVSGETRQHDSRNIRHVVTTLTAGTVVKTIAYTNTIPSAGKLVCRVYLTVIKL